MTTHQGSDAILARMMALHPKIIDLTLDRVWRLLKALGNPQNDLPPVIHIAGTNGKGSTQAMLRAGLEAAGHRVHAYTSPHLTRFHERIRLAGTLIEEDALTALLDECYAANGGDDITYFEITTCAAILAFARTPADYTILEVGLGGRLDATNVIDKPALTVITPVSMDHEAFLGDTLSAIAGEKAGIIKRQVPCIVGPQEDAGLEVIETRAAKLGAPILAYAQHWHAFAERDGMVFQDDHGLLDLPRPVLPGDHQIQNAGIAIAALRALGCDNTACTAAVTRAHWLARMQRLSAGPLVDAAPEAEIWLDGGHNPAAGQALAQVLRKNTSRPTFLICGMLNTKDVQGYLAPLAAHAQALYAVPIPGETNTLSAADTAAAAHMAGLDSHEAETVEAALRAITTVAPHARILICGSLYLAGQVLKNHS
ncbi:MAG: folylpolyglutamate synthase/dihydrofolate synthase family protein [Pseudomonadota bacterium]